MPVFFTQPEFMIALATLTVACVVAIAMMLRHTRRLLARLLAAEQLVEQLQTDVRGLCSGAVGAAKRVSRVESTLRMQKERIERVELHEPGEQSYGQAMRMAKKGAPLDELVETCGLSRGEAELIITLNNQPAIATH